LHISVNLDTDSGNIWTVYRNYLDSMLETLGHLV